MILNKNNNIKKKIIIPFSILSITTLLSLIGKSSYVLPGNEIDLTIKEDKDVKPVCYIDSNKDIKYTSIEKALEVAKNNQNSDTIYVIPGTNPIITRNCEIAKGDTLCLPYEGETYKVDINGLGEKDSSFINYHSDKFADSQEDKYLKSNVTIEGNHKNERVALTVNGTLLIGGILGVGEGSYQKPSGHTMNKYSQITMKGYSSIINNGSIECRGYIKPFDKKSIDDCILLNQNGSVISLPFVLYDYRGGSYSAACKIENVFPFSIFDIPNCHINSTYNYGSTLKVLIHAYANDQIYSPNATILLSKDKGLFKLESGSLSLIYQPSVFNKTSNDGNKDVKENTINKSLVSINGSITLDSMTISLADQSLETTDFYVPFSYKFDISVKSGAVLNIINKVKFLSGSNLRNEEGATINMDASTTFYQRYDGHNTLADVYPNSLGPAKLINNGTLNINSSFGGKVDTCIENALIYTGSNFSPEVTAREVLNGSNLGQKRTYFDITSYGYCTFYNNTDNKYIDAKLLESKSYVSNKKDNQYYWSGDFGDMNVTEIHGKEISVCITSNTLILMSNGTYKKAIDIRANDLVMSINHETGKIEPTPIVFNDHIDKEADIYDVLSLEFSNDKTVEVVYEHGFFDLDTNKYEYITLDNYQSFIGHRFVSVDYINGKFIKGIATLNKGYITNKFTRICSPVTYKNLNIITENMLSMPGGISGLFNIFEYDKNLAYDQVKKNEDINKYGLLDYSYFNNLIPYEVYEAFNGKYLKVAMGKGILTKKQLNNYIERYLPIISKQNNCH
mgnify:CR=1 FL=1